MAKEFGNKSSTKVMMILLGITVVYQGMYHLCILLPFSLNEYFAQQRARSMAQASMQAVYSCSGETAIPGQCTESELFRSWSQTTSLESVENEDPIAEEDNGPDLMALDPLGRVILSSGQPVLPVPSNSTPALDSKLPSNSTPPLDSSPVAKVEVDTTPPLAEKQLQSETKADATAKESKSMSNLIKGSKFESTEWGRGLIELEGQLEDLKTKYDEEQKRRLANSNLQGHIAGVKDRSLLEKIEDLLREMCEDPKRRDRQACERFLSPEERHDAAKAKLQSGLRKIAEKRLEWERSFVKRAKNIGKQMCMRNHRHGDAVCQPFLADVPTSAPGRILSMAFTQSAGVSKKRDEPTRVESKILNSSKWGGMIPRVACIMGVPNTTDAHVRVKFAINGFREQSYEGPTQLVMVYHYQDEDTARLLKRFADGTYIKAVPARTSVPSTTASRYGAWVARNDTDVVARWDLDTWHHPNRLAMQVRALGLTGLPVSLLGRRTLITDDGHMPVRYLKNGFQGKSPVGFGWPESLVAERSWAEKNWKPSLMGEGASLAASSGHISLLDMPELQAYTVDAAVEQP
eukprot:gnl/MRDRNA2_/MRDRNA2_93493_c0_seq1.p1 gnl/MRDRNA2_/MRDRNA2_93493_c0~~gnl/MRDRNA2_/MRDRNA2_93493_c0_seq1.p1  ORF type:complete len:575 (-),score=109.83 gnl/MRDRNA2_/MRDRNA2_93493_c0_seq1:34-1758(-)